MRWDIHPNRGLGSLRFGMTREEVASFADTIGPVTAAHPAFDGSLNEFRTMDIPVCNYIHGRLSAVDTNWRVSNVRFQEIDLYGSDPELVIRILHRANGGAHIGLGSVIFFRLGINTQGFFDTLNQNFVTKEALLDEDERGIAIFAPGTFDSLLDEYRLLELPQS